MTMREVAELAGTSSAAVSRYLNGGYISEDKAARIKAAIEQTGYVPSSQARSLRTGSSRLIGVIAPKINSESISRVTSGIGRVLRDCGYQMLLADTDNSPEQELSYLEVFQSHPVDGIILIGTVLTDRHREFLDAARVPVVVVGQRARGYACVYHDDRGAACALAQRIAELGARRVAYIGVDRVDEAVGAAREDGFRAGLAYAGIEFDDVLRRESPFSVEGGYRAASELLDCAGMVDFIACATDTIAAGAIQALHEHGVPAAADRVSGFGDNQFLRAVTGGILTVHLAFLRSGIEGARMLLDRVADVRPHDPQELMLGYELVGRQDG